MAFWTEKSLTDLSEQEWESLCDGCGKCCLIRLEDEDTGDIHTTDVHCKLFGAASHWRGRTRNGIGGWCSQRSVVWICFQNTSQGKAAIGPQPYSTL